MSDNLFITVLMTTYNCGAFIKTSINSILNQSYKQYEILIIDDGSVDNTDDIVHLFNSERINYIKLPHVGRSKALNYGLKAAKYDWVALMDADDIAVPERLEKEVPLINQYINYIIFSDSVYFKDKKISFLNKINTQKENLLQKIKLRGHICNSSVLFNRKFILQNGGYNENLNHSEDFELWIRLLNKATYIHLDEFLIFMRIRSNSLSKKASEGPISEISVFTGSNDAMKVEKIGILSSIREYLYRRKIKLKVKYVFWKLGHYNKHKELSKKLYELDRVG